MTRDRSRDEIVVTFLFGSMGARALDVATFLDELPRLCRGALADCHVGASTTADHLVCLARFRCAPPAPTRRRLEFWAWRLGGPSPSETGQRPRPPRRRRRRCGRAIASSRASPPASSSARPDGSS